MRENMPGEVSSWAMAQTLGLISPNPNCTFYLAGAKIYPDTSTSDTIDDAVGCKFELKLIEPEFYLKLLWYQGITIISTAENLCTVPYRSLIIQRRLLGLGNPRSHLASRTKCTCATPAITMCVILRPPAKSSFLPLHRSSALPP